MLLYPSGNAPQCTDPTWALQPLLLVAPANCGYPAPRLHHCLALRPGKCHMCTCAHGRVYTPILKPGNSASLRDPPPPPLAAPAPPGAAAPLSIKAAPHAIAFVQCERMPTPTLVSTQPPYPNGFPRTQRTAHSTQSCNTAPIKSERCIARSAAPHRQCSSLARS